MRHLSGLLKFGQGALVCLLWIGAVLPCADAVARTSALLVGVSEYPNLINKNLKGPRNDALAMRAELIRRGVSDSDIVVLTEGGRPEDLPTRRRIVGALEALANRAQRGDQVIILMAGHGSRVPVPEDSHLARFEADGLFEVFLPRDVERWKTDPRASNQGIGNAIADFELRERIDAITRRGADVWAIFDACHSATLVRGEQDTEVLWRGVDAHADLGMPERKQKARAAASRRPTAAEPVSAPDAGPGQAAYFYAAQSTQKAPEMPLPRDRPDGRSHGLFTYNIIRALAGAEGLTYRQLAQQVLLQYATNAEAGEVTPLFSGNDLDRVLLGSRRSADRQWTVETLNGRPAISAGQLHDLRPGASFVLLPSLTARPEEVLGFARAQAVDLATTWLEASERAEGSHSARPWPRSAKVARLVGLPPPMPVSVAVDLRHHARRDAVERTVESLRQRVAGESLVWVLEGDTTAADIALVGDGPRIWVMSGSVAQAFKQCSQSRGAAAYRRCQGELELSARRIDDTDSRAIDDLPDRLATEIAQMSRAIRLLRILGQSPGAATVVRAPEVRFANWGQRLEGTPQPIAADANVYIIRLGDIVDVVVRNASMAELGLGGSLDATILYVDSRLGIQLLWPDPGASSRLHAGDSTTARFRIATGDHATLGREYVVVLTAPARPHAPSLDLSFLARRAEAQRGSTELPTESARSGSDLLEMLSAAGFDVPAVRSERQALPLAEVSVRVLPLLVRR